MAEKLQRCAVYTRKSTEDGLDQAFNSLDAQYEACAAYAMSQRHEGWLLVSERYDDGGYSGGTMQRPAMQRLMADVAAGKVDVILLYKIDRLTRSLADFAKIVEVLDRAGASFVSITQAFNTTTSMGRLTLNMLLSFAQFEREVTGERIRDKIAASKRRGLWMGGPVPLGYDVADRKLVVNEREAALVRHIYHSYLELGSVIALVDVLGREGHRTKVQQRASGPHRGGCEFRRGTLYHLLTNRIYIGQLVHKGEHFAAEHPRIVPAELWDRVQAQLAGNAQGTSRRLRSQQPSLLVGLVYDGEGRAMTPNHATKPGPAGKQSKRYRYYCTRPDQLDGSPAWRVSAPDLEQLVCQRVSEMLGDGPALCRLAGDTSAEVIRAMLEKADLTAAALRSGPVAERAQLLAAIVSRIDLGEENIELAIAPDKLGTMLGLEAISSDDADPPYARCSESTPRASAAAGDPRAGIAQGCLGTARREAGRLDRRGTRRASADPCPSRSIDREPCREPQSLPHAARQAGGARVPCARYRHRHCRRASGRRAHRAQLAGDRAAARLERATRAARVWLRLTRLLGCSQDFGAREGACKTRRSAPEPPRLCLQSICAAMPLSRGTAPFLSADPHAGPRRGGYSGLTGARPSRARTRLPPIFPANRELTGKNCEKWFNQRIGAAPTCC